MCNFVLLLLGTIVFSSLMFISMIDAFGVVGRYILSGFVCRFILMFELNGMQVVEYAEPQDVAVNLVPFLAG